MYKPTYEFAHSENYKLQLSTIRAKQKEMIKQGTASIGNNSWTVNGNAAQGRKVVKDMQKLLLRAFNDECDTLVNNVKCNNYDSYVQRMRKACDTISKLGTIMNVSITPQYLNLKLQELALALDYQQKKQQEKEELREAKARMGEEAALQKRNRGSSKKDTKRTIPL